MTRRFQYSAAVAPVNTPVSWPSMDRTKPQSGFPFPRRKTEHRFIRFRALTAGGALAELCQRLVPVVISILPNWLELGKTGKRLFIAPSQAASWDEGFASGFILGTSNA
jgi:hypothetical protein